MTSDEFAEALSRLIVEAEASGLVREQILGRDRGRDRGDVECRGVSPARYLGPEPLIEPEPAAVEVTGLMAGGMLGHQRPGLLRGGRRTWRRVTSRCWPGCRACRSTEREGAPYSAAGAPGSDGVGMWRLVPYPAEEMTAWRVADDAKNSRIEPHPGMAEPVAA